MLRPVYVAYFSSLVKSHHRILLEHAIRLSLSNSLIMIDASPQQLQHAAWRVNLFDIGNNLLSVRLYIYLSNNNATVGRQCTAAERAATGTVCIVNRLYNSFRRPNWLRWRCPSYSSTDIAQIINARHAVNHKPVFWVHIVRQLKSLYLYLFYLKCVLVRISATVELGSPGVHHATDDQFQKFTLILRSWVG